MSKYGPYPESDFYCPIKGAVCESLGLATKGGWQARTEVEALKAQAQHYKNEADGLNKQLYYLNESTRETVNKLSAQVVGLREALGNFVNVEATRRLGKCKKCGQTVHGEQINYCYICSVEIAKELLSSPDPGEKYRERVEKMERVIESARFLLHINQNGCMSQVGESELEQALAALEGDRP